LNLSVFLIRIIFLAIPGIVTAYVFEKLTGKREGKDWKDFIAIAFFSLLSYGFYAVIVACFKVKATFLNALFDEKIPIPWSEVLWASLIAILIGYVASYFEKYKIITNVGHFIRASNRHGDEDVWDYFHNIPEVEWVFVRDHKLDLIYYGTISVFSDSGMTRELLMTDVDVYDNKAGGFLYSVNVLYFSRDRYDLTIEIPKIEKKEEKQNV